MPGINRIQQIESELVFLLSTSPLMPPTVLVRPFQESHIESGRVVTADNLFVRFQGIKFESTIESNDDIAVRWRVDFEIMMVLRDLRGHHAATQTIETILFLLTGYCPLYTSRGLVPRNVDYTEFDEDKFRYWSLRFDCELEICEQPYENPWEAVPKEVACLDDCTKWLGLNQNEEYNICWSRYQKPGDDKYYYYNHCSQREGDNERGCWFADGTKLNYDYGRNPNGIKAGLDGPPVPGVDYPWDINLGVFRNVADELGNRDPIGKIGEVSIENQTPEE
jgi:hypothetical protein